MWNPFGSAEAPPHFLVQKDGPVAVVEFQTEEIRDPETAAEVRDELRKLIDADGERALVLDLSRVRYISSTGFAVLIGFGKSCEGAGARLAIVGLHPDVQTGASICGLTRVIAAFAGVPEGVAHVAAGG